MAVNQDTYATTLAAAYPGMVANGETSNRISRTCEDAAGIGFGKAAYAGVGDHGCTGTQTLTGLSAALGTNVGNGVMGAITVSAGAKIGAYTLTVTEPATNAGAFIVTDPDGIVVSHGNVAAAFSAGGLAFTLADGATDFSAGDSFRITVSGNAFLGITIAHEALGLLSGQTVDKYQQYDDVAIMTLGVIFVTLGGTVNDRDPVGIDANGDFVTGSGVPLSRWSFDQTGVDDAIVKIAKR